MLDPKIIKKDFPILKKKINGKLIAYLDNGSTSQKPKSVIKAITDYYENYNSNTHRGIHTLSEKATEKYEETRVAVQKFINAKSSNEIIFTKGTTESINLLAYSLKSKIKKGDEILISIFEHHSNLVPWQILAKENGAKLKFIDMTEDYLLDINDLKKKLNKKTKIVSITAISNVTGTINDTKKISKIVKENSNALLIIDAAQAIGHQKINVQNIDCDFLAFSGHKMLGPTGVGVLYGKEKLLNEIPPFQYGGNMINSVTKSETIFNEIPFKFEAGTSNIEGVIAFKKAIEYLENIGLEEIKKHDQELLKYGKEKLSQFKEVKIYSPKNIKNCSSILSISIEGIHPHDIATIFDKHAIAIRAGVHCAEPLMQRLKTPATARLSFHVYNTKEDIDRSVEAIKECLKIFV